MNLLYLDVYLQFQSRVKLEAQPNRSAGKKVTFEEPPLTNEEQKENRGRAEERKPISGLFASSIVPFPSNHICPSELDSDDIDEMSDESLIQEETSESLFSLSIDSRKHVGAIETGEKEVNSPIPIPIPIHASTHEELKTNASQCLHLVLKPIENITQWKDAQAKTDTSLMKVNLEPKSNDLKPKEQQIVVDTSLSSWLVVSESTPRSKNSSSNSVRNSASEKEISSRSHEDQPILGALTLEEHLRFSVSPSPRLSKRQSPEDKLIMGTVGSYWSHTGQIGGIQAQALLVTK